MVSYRSAVLSCGTKIKIQVVSDESEVSQGTMATIYKEQPVAALCMVFYLTNNSICALLSLKIVNGNTIHYVAENRYGGLKKLSITAVQYNAFN